MGWWVFKLAMVERVMYRCTPRFYECEYPISLQKSKIDSKPLQRPKANLLGHTSFLVPDLVDI